MGVQEHLTEFKNMLKEIRTFQEAVNILYWDMRTKAPKSGIEYRSDLIASLSTKSHEVLVSEKMGNVLTALLEKKEELDTLTLRSVTKLKKDYDRYVKIPIAEYEEYVKLQSKAEAKWEEAKNNNDFESFEPFLDQLVKAKRKFVSYWQTTEVHPYDVLLDQYEPGMKVEILDPLFSNLGEKLKVLADEIIKKQNADNTHELKMSLGVEKQEELCLQLLNRLKYDFTKGRLDTTAHPFQITIHPNDVRITTKYREDDVLFSIFGVIHEFGHALYEMQLGKDLIDLSLCEGASMGVHESQSLTFENLFGRSKDFWTANIDLLKEYIPELKDAKEDFYKQINQVKRGLIRLDADEVTYPLHIIVRYEIEKELISGTLEVKDIRDAWNKRMEQYLGVTPDNDSEGVLQDVHWSGGDFGYFPSYALGFVYAAQFVNKMREEIPVSEYVKENNWAPIQKWLEEKIHHVGASKEPVEILKEVTGEGPTEKYLLEYLKEKYM